MLFFIGFFGHVYLDAKGCPLLDCLAFLFEDSKPDVLQLPVLVSVPWYSSVVRCTTTFGTTKSSIQTYKRYATRDITLDLALFVGDQFSWISWVIPFILEFTSLRKSNNAVSCETLQCINPVTNKFAFLLTKKDFDNPQTLTSHE